MKHSYTPATGASFYGSTFMATVKELEQILGEPSIRDNTGIDKVNLVWDMINKEGKLFTVYDWKEYRILPDNEPIQWHIGAYTEHDAMVAANEMQEAFNEINGEL